jgi:hypothetical protein
VDAVRPGRKLAGVDNDLDDAVRILRELDVPEARTVGPDE